MPPPLPLAPPSQDRPFEWLAHTLPATWLEGTDASVRTYLHGTRWDTGGTMYSTGQQMARLMAYKPHLLGELLDQGVSPNADITAKGRSEPALLHALRMGTPAMVALLLDRGADPKALRNSSDSPFLAVLEQRPGEPPQDRAQRLGASFALLRAHQVLPSAHWPGLMAAVTNGELGRVQEMLHHQVAVLDQAYSHGETPLTRAMTTGQAAMVDLLLTAGLRLRPAPFGPSALTLLTTQPLNPQDSEAPGRWAQRTLAVLHVLVQHGVLDPASVRHLTQQPTTMLARERLDPVLTWLEQDLTPQRWWAAIDTVDVPTVQRFVLATGGACLIWDDPAIPDRTDPGQALSRLGQTWATAAGGWATRTPDEDRAATAPGFAPPAQEGRSAGASPEAVLDLVRWLVAHGASPLAASTRSSRAPLWDALAFDDPTLARTLIDAMPPSEQARALPLALLHDQFNQLDRLLDLGVPTYGTLGGMPLPTVRRPGDPVLADESSALHLMANHLNTRALVERLIVGGAAMEAHDPTGHTPLMVAFEPPMYEQVVETLLAHGADPLAITPEGETLIDALRARQDREPELLPWITRLEAIVLRRALPATGPSLSSSRPRARL